MRLPNHSNPSSKYKINTAKCKSKKFVANFFCFSLPLLLHLFRFSIAIFFFLSFCFSCFFGCSQYSSCWKPIVLVLSLFSIQLVVCMYCNAFRIVCKHFSLGNSELLCFIAVIVCDPKLIKMCIECCMAWLLDICAVVFDYVFNRNRDVKG